jgi:hypothetical protein
VSSAETSANWSEEFTFLVEFKRGRTAPRTGRIEASGVGIAVRTAMAAPLRKAHLKGSFEPIHCQRIEKKPRRIETGTEIQSETPAEATSPPDRARSVIRMMTAKTG